jgi:hypothetical protein
MQLLYYYIFLFIAITSLLVNFKKFSADTSGKFIVETRIVNSLQQNNARSHSTVPSGLVDQGVLLNARRVNIRYQIDPSYDEWYSSIFLKFVCLRCRKLGFYFYHVRKAAGTTIRDLLRLIAIRQKLPFYETEGIVLDQKLLEVKELVTVITLRDPVQRIFSLYWYEHVQWFASVLKQPQRCRKILDWIEAWADSSRFKKKILAKFPFNNYMEIENYYIKLLIGYDYRVPRNLTNDDLEQAKEVLRKFDLILIAEWLGDESQHNIIHYLHNHFYLSGEDHDLLLPQKVKGDIKIKEKLLPELIPDEVCILSSDRFMYFVARSSRLKLLRC